MKKNIFTISGFSVANFCRNKARRRAVAVVALLGMVIGGGMQAFGLSVADFNAYGVGGSRTTANVSANIGDGTSTASSSFSTRKGTETCRR